jgi:hypothetical protein
MEAASTYRAVHAISPGRAGADPKTIQAPGTGRARIREACGVCHSDSVAIAHGADKAGLAKKLGADLHIAEPPAPVSAQ